MRIKDYLKAKDISREEFAKKAGCSPQRISYLCSGQRPPRFSLILKIIEVTGGEVDANGIVEPFLPGAAAE